MRYLFILICLWTTTSFAQNVKMRDAVYTALPNYYYFSWSEQVADNKGVMQTELRGFSKDLADELFRKIFKERGLQGVFMPSYFEAVNAVKIGKWSSSGIQKVNEGDNVDAIIGVPYNEELAKYLEYILVPIAQDNLLLAFSDKYANFEYEGKSSLRYLNQKNWFASMIRGFPIGANIDAFINDIYGYNSAKCILARSNKEQKTGMCNDVPIALKRVEAELEEIMDKVIAGKGFYYMGSMFAIFDYIASHHFTKDNKIFKKDSGEGFYSVAMKTAEDDGSIPLFIAINKKSDLLKNKNSGYDPIEMLKKELEKLKASGRLEELRSTALKNWKNQKR